MTSPCRILRSRPHLAKRRAHVLEGGLAFSVQGLDGQDLHADLVHQVPDLGDLADHADGPGDGRRMGQDFIRGHGHVVSSRGCHVAEEGHDGNLRFLAEPGQLVVDLVGGGDSASRAVDVQDDGFDRLVLADGVEHRADLPPSRPGAVALLHDHALDRQDYHLRGGVLAVEQRFVKRPNPRVQVIPQRRQSQQYVSSTLPVRARARKSASQKDQGRRGAGEETEAGCIPPTCGGRAYPAACRRSADQRG